MGNISESKHQVCSRCIFDTSIPEICFDESGICNFCATVEELKLTYGTASRKGKLEIENILNQIKIAGKDKKYDCIVGVSGGVDSSYMLHWAVENGLRPLAVHYDNTWNSEIATMNIAAVTNKLGVDLATYVVNNREMDQIYHCFLKAGVPAIDIVTDLGFTEVLYRYSKQYKIKYVLEGHSFIEEGVSPVSYSYFDGKYIADVCAKNGLKSFSSYPNMTLWRFLYWTLFARIKKIRPYWYIDYSKQTARQVLEQNYGWRYYGGHHLENRMTAFSYSYHNPKKFGMDQRNNLLSAQCRNGYITQERALEEYARGPKISNDLVRFVQNRLDITDEKLNEFIKSENRSWRDFETYKPTFELLKPLFFVMAKLNLVPMSFYRKYCFKIGVEK